MAGTEDGIVMVEAGAQQVSEDEVFGAIEFGHECCRKIAAAIREAGRSMSARPKRDLHAAAGQPGALRTDLRSRLATSSRTRSNTKKYPKLESYAEVAELKKTRGGSVPEEQRAEAAKLFDALKEQHLPRRDAERSAAVRTAARSTRSATSPSKPACCRARTARRCSPAARRRRWSR